MVVSSPSVRYMYVDDERSPERDLLVLTDCTASARYDDDDDDKCS